MLRQNCYLEIFPKKSQEQPGIFFFSIFFFVVWVEYSLILLDGGVQFPDYDSNYPWE